MKTENAYLIKISQERVYEEKCIGENAARNLIGPPGHPIPKPPSMSGPPPLPAKTIGRAGCSSSACGGGLPRIT